jgi:hypothetical protein
LIPKTKTAVATQGAALVVGGGVVAAIATTAINHSFLAGIWPIAKEILSIAAPVIVALLTRGPGHVSE